MVVTGAGQVPGGVGTIAIGYNKLTKMAVSAESRAAGKARTISNDQNVAIGLPSGLPAVSKNDLRAISIGRFLRRQMVLVTGEESYSAG